MEVDKGIQEKTEKFEREKYQLLEQNKQMKVELEQVKVERDLLHSSRKEQESELVELRQNKELLSQWEKQIADIIQWVTEEKDARWALLRGVVCGMGCICVIILGYVCFVM